MKETRGYWKLKEDALDRTVWRTGFGKDYGSVDKAECWKDETCSVELLRTTCAGHLSKHLHKCLTVVERKVFENSWRNLSPFYKVYEQKYLHNLTYLLAFLRLYIEA